VPGPLLVGIRGGRYGIGHIVDAEMTKWLQSTRSRRLIASGRFLESDRPIRSGRAARPRTFTIPKSLERESRKADAGSLIIPYTTCMIKSEESPGSIGQRCQVTPGKSNLTTSATEKNRQRYQDLGKGEKAW
jgi:hypothetical protein